MIPIILVSHGRLSYELLNSANMIIRNQIEDIYPVSLDEDTGIDTLKEKLLNISKKIKGNEVLILCDIKGGSPFNTSLIVFKNYNYKILTGMNLPMLLEVLMNRNHTTLDSLADIAVKAGALAVECIKL